MKTTKNYFSTATVSYPEDVEVAPDIFMSPINYLSTILNQTADNIEVVDLYNSNINTAIINPTITKNYGEHISNNINTLLNLIYLNPTLANKIRVTSTYRPNAKTKQGRISNHSSGNAVDIVPLNGNFKELEHLLMSDPNIVEFMKLNGYGILDETSKTMLQRTGATGAHFHIGPDTLAKQHFNNLLGIYGYIV